MFCERCNRPFSLSCKCCKIWTIVKLFLLHFNTLLLGTPHCKPNSFFDRWNIHSQKVYERKLNTFKRFSIELQLPVYILKNILTYFPLKSCVPKAVFLVLFFFLLDPTTMWHSHFRGCDMWWYYVANSDVLLSNWKLSSAILNGLMTLNIKVVLSDLSLTHTHI